MLVDNFVEYASEGNNENEYKTRDNGHKDPIIDVHRPPPVKPSDNNSEWT